MLRNKLYEKWEKVLFIKVPQYNFLNVKDLLKFANSKLDLSKYLENYEYNKKPNREWFCKLFNTLICKNFQDLIWEKQKLENIN